MVTISQYSSEYTDVCTVKTQQTHNSNFCTYCYINFTTNEKQNKRYWITCMVKRLVASYRYLQLNLHQEIRLMEG